MHIYIYREREREIYIVQGAPNLNTVDPLHSTYHENLHLEGITKSNSFHFAWQLAAKMPNRQQLQQKDRKASQKDLTKLQSVALEDFRTSCTFGNEWIVLHTAHHQWQAFLKLARIDAVPIA